MRGPILGQQQKAGIATVSETDYSGGDIIPATMSDSEKRPAGSKNGSNNYRGVRRQRFPAREPREIL